MLGTELVAVLKIWSQQSPVRCKIIGHKKTEHMFGFFTLIGNYFSIVFK